MDKRGVARAFREKKDSKISRVALVPQTWSWTFDPTYLFQLTSVKQGMKNKGICQVREAGATDKEKG